jgi:hypothetical protein
MFLELFKKVIRTFFFDRRFDDLSLGATGSKDDQQQKEGKWKNEKVLFDFTHRYYR